MEIFEAPEVYERIISESEEFQTKLVINTFRGVEYLHIRKYYMDFSGDWCASNQGIAIPLDLDVTLELFQGLAEVISLAESREVIEEYFGDIIRNTYLQ
jgi:hypothetical protein